MKAARDKAVPMGRIGSAWDVANAAAFIGSDEAAFITGVCLAVGSAVQLLGIGGDQQRISVTENVLQGFPLMEDRFGVHDQNVG
jgi:hypothetical protein